MMIIVVLATIMASNVSCDAQDQKYFHIKVVDKETGRGVPLVELKTVNGISHVTDSAGNIAFYEPGLMKTEVYFHVSGHGYIVPKDGFGYRGVRLVPVAGKKYVVKINRNNLAERLYRITGAGIYRDTTMLGLTPPIKQPLLNGKVLGSDSVVNAIYRGKLYWFWGDTNRPGYPLGNFEVSGASSALPNAIDPDVGIDLDYFVNNSGFAKKMAPVPGAGPTWIFGSMVLNDRDGNERMLAKYEKIKPPLQAYERGLVLFNDEKQQFEPFAKFDLNAPLFPSGQSLLVKAESRTDVEQDYVYFANPFPLIRVRASIDAIKNPKNYEAFSYFKTDLKIPKNENGVRQFSADQLDRDKDGKLVAKWRLNSFPISPATEISLLNKRLITKDETIALLSEADSKKQLRLASGSVAWNDYRKKWIMIAVQSWGSSMLGEIWFAESESLEGPWKSPTKIVTHNDYSFYNPRHHAYFDKDGGRVIYFEGTYTKMFSGTKTGTPRYDYNQIMYRLDMSKLPN